MTLRTTLTVVLIALLCCICTTAVMAADDTRPEPFVGFCLDSLTAGMSWENATSSNKQTYGQYNYLCFSSENIQGKLTVEYWSDGYDRYTVYAGPKGGSTTAAVRWDDCDRLWIGTNHVQKVSKELTLVARPLIGANSSTENRLYLIADYSNGNKIGAMAFFAGVADNHKTEDTYVGPTYRNGRASYWLAANISNGGAYVDVSYTVPLK
jgi:hypothetical protein